MSDNVVALPALGKTYLNGPNRTPDSTPTSSKAIEGIVKRFKNVNYNSTTGAQVKDTVSGGDVIAILVRNASGIALTPGRLVTWKTTLQGRQVDGYSTVDYAQCAGVVDPFLPTAGVAANDYFWIFVKGLCLVKKAADTNTLTKDDYVLAVTAASSQNAAAGRIQSIALVNNATTATLMALNRIGVASSTSNTSGADILVRLDLY